LTPHAGDVLITGLASEKGEEESLDGQVRDTRFGEPATGYLRRQPPAVRAQGRTADSDYGSGLAGIGPTYRDAVGAQLLTAVLTMPAIVKERHDTLDFENHVYIKHSVRLIVAVDHLFPSPEAHHRRIAPYPVWGGNLIQAGRGRVVVPLGDLDRHSRATTHITDERSELVPRFTSSELNAMLGSGLVCFAALVLEEPPRELIAYLRSIPINAGLQLEPVGGNPQDAADKAFERACEDLLREFGRDAVQLLRSLEFRVALAAITSAVQLVVAVDPEQGQTRVFSYSYIRPITATPPAREGAHAPGWLARLKLRLKRYWCQSGSTNLSIDLGPVGGCERYQLTATAPFDTWFAQASMLVADAQIEKIDIGQRFRISYLRASSRQAWSAVLRVRLMTVYTGVTRASVYASTFLAVCVLLGTVRVVLARHHTLISSNTDTAASLLLLFPGIAATAVAGVARNTLTATLQFPMRLSLWIMSVVSFVLATAAAFRLGGATDIALWGAASVLICAMAVALVNRSRAWNE
jgi:hypothetical protein